MNPEVQTLFHELADLTVEQREVYFQERRVTAQIRAEVEELLSYDHESGEELAACVASSAQVFLELSDGAVDGTRCGPYRLLRVLGTGGMGEVYLAERADGEVQQRVAIKFLRHSRAEPAFLDRFLRERQILANLNHSGIARLLDAGRAAGSWPYLVMDYIDGVPIDSYVGQLDLRRKLQLFLKVCDAVSYAHRNLIIHRDIKPSNLLVDSAGEPKLLDFGIAKILDAQLNETHTIERLLTPEYASPEQIKGQVQTTATDIYSLGAVLYKILTGKSPHVAGKTTPQEIMASITSEEPAPASRVKPGLPRDLDFITSKALRKQPAERYPSVEALADDVRAFLEWRPIRARAGNAWYRARQFSRRYWAPFTAAVVAFVSLAVGLTIALHQRNLAEKRFATVRRIANELFNVEHDISSLTGSTAARERIVRTSLDYLEGLSKDAGSDLSLKAEIGASYVKVAEIQGVYGHLNLGHPQQALASLQKAEATFRELWKAQPDNRQHLRNLIETIDFESRIDLAKRDLKQLEAKVAELESLLATYEQHATSGTSEWSFLAAIHESLSASDLTIDHTDQGGVAALRSIEYRRKVVREDKAIQPRSSLANSLATYAHICRNVGKLEESIQALEESITLLEGILAEQPKNFKAEVNLADSLMDLARDLGGVDGPSLGRKDRAVEYYERALRLGREAMAADANETTVRYNQSVADWRFASMIHDQDPVRALAAYDEATELLRASTAKNFTRDVPLLSVLAESALPLRRLHREREAEERLQEAKRMAVPYRTDVRTVASLHCGEVLSRVEADWALASGRPLDAVAIHRAFVGELETNADNLDTAHEFVNAFLVAHHYRLLANSAKAAGLESEASQAESKRRQIVETWKKNMPGRPSVEAALLR